jgi:ammonium transporter, Amt family
MIRQLRLRMTAAAIALLCGIPAFAQESPPPATETAPAAPAVVPLDTGHTAWMLTSSALVLMMTAPGLAMFYGGLVRKKNVLGVIMQCLFLMGLMTIVWVAWGFSFAFSGSSPYVGNLDMVFLKGVLPGWDETAKAAVPVMHGSTGIPKLLFAMYQGMFFIITPALICGAFAERMKFSTMCVYSVLWGTFVYCPVAHWVWSDNGWLFGGDYAAIDFAGGTVVHITSGVSALVCALLIGKRLGFGQEPMPPHNLTYTTLGAAMLWVGWFGFNAGSAVAANQLAVNAFASTHVAAAAGLIAWSVAEWIGRGHPSVLGAASGAVAGLVCITPAAGSVDPVWAIVLGLAAGYVCYFACTKIKNTFKYDDSLDAFGVHGVGGTLGAVLSGVFATKAASAGAYSGVIEGNWMQLRNQVIGAGAAIVLAVVGSIILLKILDAVMGLRVSQEEEIQGLDLSQHGEEGYIFL